VLTVSLPFPAPELFPNRVRGHWAKTSGAKAQAIADAYALTYQAVSRHKGPWYPPTGAIPLRLEFFPPDKRHRDLDNMLAAMKASLDGVATALTVNDKQFGPITLIRGGTARPACVVVSIGEAA
jgi:crossover junction endodeoxyribonuclease RusA